MAKKDHEEKMNLTRRDFLKTTGAVAAAGIAANGLILSGSTLAHAQETPGKWDDEVDVIVVGSGFAGLAAAFPGPPEP